jgi:hypothetical protein
MSGYDYVLIPFLSLLFGYFGAFLKSYSKKKGENLATKEDVADITKKVEEVKNQFFILQEENKQKNRLQLAALDKRLEKHQEAYSLVWKLIKANSGTKKEMDDMVFDCQEWWINNNLYLSKEASQAFRTAYISAIDYYTEYRMMGKDRNSEFTKKCWDNLKKSGEIIQESVALPGLSPENREELLNKNS